MSLHTDSMVVAVAPRRNHRFCAWCHGDLGLLVYPSIYPSYGICATCQRAYFVDYYREDVLERTILRERAIGVERQSENVQARSTA